MDLPTPATQAAWWRKAECVFKPLCKNVLILTPELGGVCRPTITKGCDAAHHLKFYLSHYCVYSTQGAIRLHELYPEVKAF